MSKRRLAAFVLPLAAGSSGPWSLLRFDGEAWFLVARAAPHAEQALSRVQVALEFPGARWLRLQWGRRWWPHERHVWLRRREHEALWPLMGAALALHQGRPWLGG